MRLQLTAVDAASARRLEVVLDLCPADLVSAVELAVGQLLAPVSGTGLWLATRRLGSNDTVLTAGLRSGCELWLGGPAPGTTVGRPGPAQLRVVGGPDAGAVFTLAYGVTVVGCAPSADVRLSDAEVNGEHLQLTISPAGAVATALGPVLPVLIDGIPLTSPVPVGPGTQLTVGRDLLTVTAYDAPDAAVTAAPDCSLEVNRPPRLRPAEPSTVVEFPLEPPVTEPRKLAMLPLLLPVLLGIVMAFLLSPLFLLFTLMSPIIAVSSFMSDRRSGRAGSVKATSAHAIALLEAERQVAAASAAEAIRRREAFPDPAAVLLMATGPRRRLWERRRGDDDTLVLRVGTGASAPTSVRVASATAHGQSPPVAELADVPVVLPMCEIGVVGIAGDRSHVRSVARWLIAQAAVLSSPRDLRIVLLVDPAAPPAAADWGFFRWLPHAAPTDGQDCLALVGEDQDSLSHRVLELTSLVAARTRAARDVHAQLEARALPLVLVVLDGARGLRGLSGMAQVLRDGPAVAVHSICLDDHERLLPEECSAVVTCDGDAELTVRRSGDVPQRGVRADVVSSSWSEQVARALAPVRDVSSEDGQSQLPTSARLLDLLRLDPPRSDDIRARWRLGGRSTAAPVGLTTDGAWTLDLRRDGPHALIAGTTGAGKSEFLQTLVASLAVANRPDAMTFVLVDYKGGAAFKDCARLPHTVGLVTDLDGHLVERALASLSAELTTREQLLGAVGAKDIEDYWDSDAPPPLPRLVIVIDEFASMIEELPEFVRGLVGIAQRGRSLGVHLVLATQRPSGVVSPEIRANTNLRVALRVTDVAESQDVIDAPDAASIAKSTPGRGYVRTGHTSLQLLQSARVGGRRPGLAVASQVPVTAVAGPWSVLGQPAPATTRNEPEPDQDQTDLHALVEAIREAAADLPPQRGPWLEPLPAMVRLSTLFRGDASALGEGPATTPAGPPAALPLRPVPYGLADLPERQVQQPAVLDLEHGSHLLVVGAPRSGRSTMLRTVAGAIALRCQPQDVHLYALDCGNGALLPVAGLPHCGTVVQRSQVGRADRLLTRLTIELARRQDLLAAGGFADVAEQRAAAVADRLPFLVLLVDRWEGFLSAFDDIDAGRLTDTFLRLLREGPGAGLRVVVAGDRSALLSKISSSIEDTLVLRLADRSDYALAGLSPRLLPSHIESGRAFRGDSGVEVQIALLGTDGSGVAQAAELGTIVSTWATAPALPRDRRPFRVEVLPARLTYGEIEPLPSKERGPLVITIGVGGDELAAVTVDLALLGPGFTIAGPARSGRSTALLAAAGSLLAAGTQLCILAPRPSPLRDLAGAAGVLRVVTDSDPRPEDLVSTFNEANGAFAVLIDDAELLHASDVQPLLQQVLRDGRDLGHCLIVAGTTDELAGAFRGFTADVRKSRSGLLLSPQSHLEGELLGARLARSAAFNGPPGRGLLITPGQVLLVQVPVP